MTHPVESVKLYAAVFAALLALTLTTVAISKLELGEYNFIAAMTIAVLKGTLVVMFFMNVRHATSMTKLFASELALEAANTAIQWPSAERALAVENGFGLAKTARMLAMAQVATADSLLGCFDAKYHYFFWRPRQAIPNADRDGKPVSRIFRTIDFGYRTITVERPQRDAAGKVVLGSKGKQKGKPQPDTSLRDTENVPLDENVDAYFEREVKPYVPDAWIDHDKTKVGYEIPFNRHFYVFQPPRPLEEIDAELKQTTDRIVQMIAELSA